MAERWEYDVVSLKTEHDANDRRRFKWNSCRGNCHDVDHSGLEKLLNEMGSAGWQVISHDTDSRFGSTLILKRALPDEPAAPTGKVRAVAVTSPETTRAMEAVVSEVKQMREAFLWHQPMDAAKRLQEQQRDREAEEASRYLQSEAFKEAIAPVLEELKTQRAQTPPPQAPLVLDEGTLARLEAIADRPIPQPVVDPAAFAALEETLKLAITQAVATPTKAVLEPESIRWLEEALRGRDDQDPPAGPPVAIMDPAAMARLEQALARAVPASPVMHATASLDADGITRLAEAFDHAARALPVPRATLDEAVTARFAEVLRQAIADTRPVEAVLTPEIVTQLERALANLPAPTLSATVQAQATLSAEAVSELRSLLTAVAERAERPVVLPTLDVAPLVTALMPVLTEIRAAYAQPIEARVPEATLQRIESAVRQLAQTVELVTAPKLIEPVAREESRRRMWAWPKLSGRLRWAR